MRDLSSLPIVSRLLGWRNQASGLGWWTLVLLGCFAWVYSALAVGQMPLSQGLQVACWVLVALVASYFPIKVARTEQTFSAASVFTTLVLLMQGPAAATLAASAEVMGTLRRTPQPWHRVATHGLLASLAMYLCGSLLHATLPGLQANTSSPVAALLMAAMMLSSVMHVLSCALRGAAQRLWAGEPLLASDLVQGFGWTGIAHAVTGALGGILYNELERSGVSVVLAAGLIVALLFTTLHFFTLQQESDDAVRQAAAEALEREAELAASIARERAAAQKARHLRELELSERRFHSAFTHASIGMALMAFDGSIRQANPALHGLLGLAPPDLEGRGFREFVHPGDLQGLQIAIHKVALRETEAMSLELRCRDAQGQDVWAGLHASLFSEPGTNEQCFILQIQDISARRRAESALHHRAFHDPLTGLANRDRFNELLAMALQRTSEQLDYRFAVLFLDFDRFKVINDSKGHAAGDEFLVQVSRRLQGCLRSGDALARLGGDEFAILAGNLPHDTDAVRLADRLLEALQEPLQLTGLEWSASASIGITFSSMGYKAPEDMLRDADIAMYRAKNDGKARYALFDVSLHTEASNRLRLENDLRHALHGGPGLSVAYQPLFELDSGRLKGFEALARWDHPELGPVSPCTFIPVAEDSGLVVQLTDFVLEQACRDLHHWQLVDTVFAELTMNVNIAAKDVSQGALVPRVTHALGRHGVQARHLTIELTENILMTQLSHSIGMLEELRELGVGLSVDDFGTGYSSLSHLSTLPIDSLKIDMSFVHQLRIGSSEAAVIRAIVLLGRSLGKQVVAEGIETLEQAEQLRDLGCDTGQGFHLSRPLPGTTVPALLEAQRITQTTASRGDGAAAATHVIH
jgi:diguanylate cyclase (GGDEF)-like protein/PAS domain S-box-containing protein